MYGDLYRITVLSALFSSFVFAQTGNELELDRYSFNSGETVSLRVTISTAASFSVFHIPLPDGVDKIALESIALLQSGQTIPYWITRDSSQFARRIPQTVWVTSRADGLWFELAQPLAGVDPLQIILRMSTTRQSGVADAEIDLRVRTAGISKTNWQVLAPSRALTVKAN